MPIKIEQNAKISSRVANSHVRIIIYNITLEVTVTTRVISTLRFSNATNKMSMNKLLSYNFIAMYFKVIKYYSCVY